MLVFSGPCDATGLILRKAVAVILAIGICQIPWVSSVFASEVSSSAVPSDPNFDSSADVLEPPTNGITRSKRSPVMDMIYSSISYRTADSKSRTLIAPNQPDPAKLLDELHDYTHFQSIDRNHFNSIDKTHPYYSALHPHLPSSLRNEEESSDVHVRTANYHSNGLHEAALQPDEIKYVDATKFSFYLPDEKLETTTYAPVPYQEDPSNKYNPIAPPEEPVPQAYSKVSEDLPPLPYYAPPKPYTMKILKEEPYDNEYEQISPPIASFTPPEEAPKYEAENPYDLNSRRGGHGGGGHGGHGGHGGGGHGGSHGHGTSIHHNEGLPSGPPAQASKPPPYSYNPHPSVKAALLELRRRLYNISEGEDAELETRDLHPRNSLSSSSAYNDESPDPSTTPVYSYSAPVPSYGGKNVAVAKQMYVPTTPIPYKEESSPSSYGQPQPPPTYAQPPIKNETNYKAPYDSTQRVEDPIHPLYEYTTKAPEEVPYEKTFPDSPPYLPTTRPAAQETGNLHSQVGLEESPYDKFYYVDHSKIDYGSLAHISSDVHYEPKPVSIYTEAYPTDGPLYEANPHPPPTYNSSTSSPPTYSEDPYASPDKTYGTTKPPSYDLPVTSSKPKPYNQSTSSYGEYPSSPTLVYTNSSPIGGYYVATTPSPYSSQSYTPNLVPPQSDTEKYSTYDVETRAEHHQNADIGSQSNSHNSKDHVAFVGQPETPSRVISINNVQYKVMTDTLTPPKSLDPSSAFSSESSDRPGAPQKNQKPVMDPQTARRVLELLTRVYAAKAQPAAPAQRYDPSRTQPTRYFYNYPSTTNSKPTFSPYLNNGYSGGYQQFTQVVPVRSESTQTYRLQGTRNLPPVSYSQLNSPQVARYPYSFNNSPPFNVNQQQPGNPSGSSGSGNPLPAYQYVYTTNPVKSGESSYANSYSTGYSIKPTSPRRKRSISMERSIPTGNRYSYAKSPSTLNPEHHNSLDDDYDHYYSSSEDSNWNDNTENEFQQFFNNWLIKSLKKPETMRPTTSQPPQTSAFKSGKRLTRNFSTNRFSIPSTTTTTTTTTTPRTKLYRKDPKVPKGGKPSLNNGGTSNRKTPPKGLKPPKTIYKIRSPHKNMSREQIEDMLRASGLDLENAEIQIINAEEFDEHTSQTRPSRPRPISPVDTFHPSQQYRHTTLKPTTTTTQPSTTKKVYVPHKDTEKHEDGSFVYIGSHNLIFPGLYSDET